MTKAGTSWLRWVAAAVVAAIVVFLGARDINQGGIDPDATQSVTMAANLVHHGTMSLSDQPPYLPSDYREPIPVALLAIEIRIMEALIGPASADDYLGGARLEYLKYQNLLWLLLLCAGVFACIKVGIRDEANPDSSSSFYVSLAGAALGGIWMSAGNWGAAVVNDLATDLAGGAVLSVASAAFAQGLVRGRPGICLLAGALFGALSLVKAATLYVFVGLIGLLLCTFIIYRQRLMLRRSLVRLALILAAFLVVVAPWMLRNLVELGALQIAQRGGVVLMVRAIKDQMSADEYRGAFYVWAPDSLKAPIGSILGFNSHDLQRGGRLQHLNRSETSDFYLSDRKAEASGRPEDAVAYYRQARAEREKLQAEFVAQGSPDPQVEADSVLQKRALATIKAHLGEHLLVTLPFLWRGAALAFPIVVIAMALGLRYRRYRYVLLALPSFGLIMFYALLSHFLPRYGMPVRPIVVALVVIAAKLTWDGLRNRQATGSISCSTSS